VQLAAVDFIIPKVVPPALPPQCFHCGKNENDALRLQRGRSHEYIRHDELRKALLHVTENDALRLQRGRSHEYIRHDELRKALLHVTENDALRLQRGRSHEYIRHDELRKALLHVTSTQLLKQDLLIVALRI